MDKYTFYTTKNKVIAVSTYAGKVVRGVAKCDPRDEFDLEKGKELAAARCGEKIAAKRLKNASKKYKEALEIKEIAERKVNKMIMYKIDSVNAYTKAKEKVENIEKSL